MDQNQHGERCKQDGELARIAKNGKPKPEFTRTLRSHRSTLDKIPEVEMVSIRRRRRREEG